MEEKAEEMKERDRDERGTGRNRRNRYIPPLPLPATRITGLAELEANLSWTPW